MSGGGASAGGRNPISDRRLVLYDRPTTLVPAGAPGDPFDDMVCTYHCRQMMRSLRPLYCHSSEREKKTLKKELSYMKEVLTLSAFKLNAELEKITLREENYEGEAGSP